ncbi:hypothetical protein RHMOL_Rhmol05G0223900 [Rhododendron molle]|uniref:Uncharacterized protein n=5 Tax=Rhododendron molle TaxID=49168 RepID=A0ACC0NU99_RHOML|nr:hypothetical protein RHMOL_Rhmol05G0223900 [Rhododendron molle]KAI8556070.1 hypothetical protein RHMOL_Rhmol05G0223900 [Rhododendron molle]KAI8556071.1 hypothetical protein RHMOL_Rhmol05G0223900 [Rhododendron molle]KAI8556072.1 hypothetical protein RHMOL_Rhmol05G0223900 [Rhododendron molle]KAI8556073.1 hypothetical protein RHMOL_Rhmol05G0223900 [Rhododendron molle]
MPIWRYGRDSVLSLISAASSSVTMASSLAGNTFDTLFPPLRLSSSTSALKLRFTGLRKPVSMLSNNSLHCGMIPLLVKGSGLDNDNQGNSSSVSRVNLLDFLESVTVTNNDHLEIKEDNTPIVKQVKGLNQEVRALWAELDSKKELIDSINGSCIALPGGVEMGSLWKDKVVPPSISNTRMTFQYFPPTVEWERITVSPPSVVEVQGAKKWKDCLVGHFVDNKIPFHAVRSVAFKKWADYGLVDVLSSDKVDLLMSSGKMVSIAIKYPWRPVKCGACKVFSHFECSQREESPLVHTDDIPFKGLTAPKGKVWVVKPGGGESVLTPLEVFEPVVTMVALAVRELPCSNQFEALQVVDSSVNDTSEGVMGLKVTEVRLDSGISVIKDSLGSALVGSDPNYSKACGRGLEWIIVAWDTQGPKVSVLASSDQLLLLSVQMDNRYFALSVVYGFNQTGPRKNLWNELRTRFTFVGGQPWIVIIDFNVVRWQNEKSNSSHFDANATGDFNNCIEDIEMEELTSKDLPLFTHLSVPLSKKNLSSDSDRSRPCELRLHAGRSPKSRLDIQRPVDKSGKLLVPIPQEHRAPKIGVEDQFEFEGDPIDVNKVWVEIE